MWDVASGSNILDGVSGIHPYYYTVLGKIKYVSLTLFSSNMLQFHFQEYSLERLQYSYISTFVYVYMHVYMHAQIPRFIYNEPETNFNMNRNTRLSFFLHRKCGYIQIIQEEEVQSVILVKPRFQNNLVSFHLSAFFSLLNTIVAPTLNLFKALVSVEPNHRITGHQKPRHLKFRFLLSGSVVATLVPGATSTSVQT